MKTGRQYCAKCHATHGYWDGKRCMICAINYQSKRQPKPKMPDYSDPNVASQL